MTAKHFIVATAGHVDHGKSALVKALTGIDPDRLPEEKARGITIDLGFANLELTAPSTINHQRSTVFRLGIVDVPGHEDFVKNMVAGVGSIDLALFVVAADDGWMPQTEEHLQILTYLGITRAVVALTKIDLVGNETIAAQAIREKLSDTPFANSPIVPTSVISGRGLDELKESLAGVLADTPSPRDIGKPRLPVDRVFTLRGIGTIVTGTLTGGTFSRGQGVVIQPTGKPTRIRTIQSHNRDVETSSPGTRTALNLADISVATKGATVSSDAGVRRGEVITMTGSGGPSDTLDVLLEKSARLAGGKSLPARPLKDGALVRVHHGSGNFPARILLSDQKQIGAGERAIAQLRFASPVFVFAGDRFIVRDWAEQATLAGGVVLDPDASRKYFRSEAQRKCLERLPRSFHDVAACAKAQLERDGITRRASLLLKFGFSAKEVAETVAWLEQVGKVTVAGELVADATWWKAIRQRAADAIDAEHKTHPDHAGLTLHGLRSAIESELSLTEVFDALVADLCRTGFVQEGFTIKRATHRPALPPQLQAAGAKLRTALTNKPFDPISRKELTADTAAQEALRFLLQSGEAVEISAEVVLSADALARATKIIKDYLREHGSATVSELRKVVGSSRRIVVPLLERLDRNGITRREADKRVLRTTG